MTSGCKQSCKLEASQNSSSSSLISEILSIDLRISAIGSAFQLQKPAALWGLCGLLMTMWGSCKATSVFCLIIVRLVAWPGFPLALEVGNLCLEQVLCFMTWFSACLVISSWFQVVVVTLLDFFLIIFTQASSSFWFASQRSSEPQLAFLA